MTAIHLIIHGRVQAVFYRDWMVSTARGLGIAGWVRNLPDDTVEAHLEGEPETVRAMIEAMHEGPSRAQVQRIEERKVPPEGLHGFARR
ncbi:acylphosphatase [Porphyrobacter algicida]|uniref:acylphosphatase n=1 Tax=Qipengyuania algicida TaxID=1836209 RepID=A0A845AIG0_9SPHN|nr:acylphosphatase [Qipengyuania algicida]MXP30050.1 acylphosphatase [Qipengyuania algicida]